MHLAAITISWSYKKGMSAKIVRRLATVRSSARRFANT